MPFLVVFLLSSLSVGIPKPAMAASTVTEKSGEKNSDEVTDKDAQEALSGAKAAAEEQTLKDMNNAEAVPLNKDAVAPVDLKTPLPVEAHGLDVQMRRLADAMALGLKRLPGDHRDQIFAVFPFDDVGEATKEKQMGLVVTDQIINDLFQTHRLNLVERGALKQILTEQEIGQMGLVKSTQAVEVGQLSGARALVVGQVTDKGEIFQIAGRVVDATSGEIFVSEVVDVDKKDLVAFSANAVVLKSKGAALIRSALIPGWGQFYNGDKLKAAFVGGAFATALIGVGVTSALAYSTHQAYSGFTPENYEAQTGQKISDNNQQEVVAGLREQANTQYSAAAMVGVAAGLLWLFGITDAYISGIDVDSLDAAMSER